jgi:hypothetical protein
LTACSTASTATQSSKTKSFTGQAELIVGIFKLKGTDQAITTKQASELLPLWEAIRVLVASDTSAQQDVSAFEQSLNTGTTIQSSSTSTTSSRSSSSSGGPPDGGGPGGDSLSGVVSGSSQVQNSTTSTKSVLGTSQTLTQIPTALLDAVIKLMKTRLTA